MAERAEAEEFRERFRRHVPKEAREHFKAAREEIKKSVEAFMPPEFVAHRKAARREMLLAARSLIDHALERMSKNDAAG
jgi:vacuolar-type H+-ATPase subunit H